MQPVHVDPSTEQGEDLDSDVEKQDQNEFAELRTPANLISLVIFLAKKASGTRPNFNEMSLMARCLAFAGIDVKDEKPQSNGAPHERFRELFFRGNDQDENFLKDFGETLAALQKDVFLNSSVVITTFFNSADKFLSRHFLPDWIIGDEVGATQDAELLIPIASNMATVERFIGVGDGQQLAPVVLSHKQKNTSEGMINEFAEGLIQPLILRAQKAGLPVSMFKECFRCTAGLEQPSSKLFYNDKVVSGAGTDLKDRKKSQKTVEFLKTTYNYVTDIPRLVFDLKNGICLTAPSGSRFNLHNITQTMDLIEALVENDIFSPAEIAIESPYREQNTRYRAAMAKASKSPFWADRDIWEIQLMTVDSFQGGERSCIIL